MRAVTSLQERRDARGTVEYLNDNPDVRLVAPDDLIRAEVVGIGPDDYRHSRADGALELLSALRVLEWTTVPHVYAVNRTRAALLGVRRPSIRRG